MLLSDTVYPTTGDDGDVFWPLLKNILDLHRTNIQFIQKELEGSIRDIFGDGILKGSYTPTLLTIGTGLNLDIGSHTTINGFANVLANPYSQPIPPSVTKYVWELQNNTDLSPSYVLTDTIPVYPLPGTVDNLPTLLGQVTTNGTNVTAITEMFNIIGGGPYLELAGGVMTGDINANGHNIVGVENLLVIGHISDTSGDVANTVKITAGNTSQAFLFSTTRLTTPHIVVTPQVNPLTNYWISGISTAGFTVNIAALQAFDIIFNFISLE